MSALAPIVRQKIEIPYSYVAGPAVTRFLLGLKDQKFIAGVCSACGLTTVPPLSSCGRCWCEIQEFREVGPDGTLESFASVPHMLGENQPGQSLQYGLVRLDGATCLLVHFVLSNRPLRSGLRVRPRWQKQRSGNILDLAGFELIG